MSAWPGLAVASAMLILNGVFVALEFSLIASRRTKLEEQALGGSRSAARALAASGELSLQLAGAQLGITIASLVLGLVGEPAMARIFLPPVEGLGISGGLARTLAGIIGLLTVVFLHLVVGELVPKNAALADPERSLRWLSLPNAAYLFAFGPAIRVLNALANLGTRAVGVKVRNELSTVPTAEELAVMLRASRDEGLIEDFAHELLAGVLDFGDRDVASIMAPRGTIRAIGTGTTVREAEAVVVESGHSRLPVEGPHGLDDVIGFIHAKDLLTLPAHLADRPVPLRLVRSMPVVPADRSLEDLLLAMRRARVHFALVTGPDGSTAGIVTLEDLLEELVGDILDESD